MSTHATDVTAHAPIEQVSLAGLQALMTHTPPPAVSLLLPLDPSAPSGEATRLVLRNLIGSARRALTDWPGADADGLLASATALLDDDRWWRHRAAGYSHFVAGDGRVSRFWLPVEVAPRAVVNTHFMLRDLIPAVQVTEDFFVLAISQNRVRLFAASVTSLVAVEPAIVPGSLAEALVNFEHSNDLDRHGGSPFGSGVHGQGSARDVHKAELERYFRAVDDAVCHRVGASEAPLVLAIDAPLAPIYRAVSRHPHVADTIVAGNPDLLGPADLVGPARAAAAPVLGRPRARRLARLTELAGSGRASQQCDAIVVEACRGRVDTLFVADHEPLWGRVDEAAGLVERHDEPRPGDDDLVNRAVVETLRHRGTVYAVPDLGGAAAGALFRY